MTWAILGIGTLVVTVLLVLIVRFTVTVSRMSANALASVLSIDQRAQQEREASRQMTMGLIDRFLSGDWEAVRLHEGARETEWGGFISPKEQSEEEQEVVADIPRPEEDDEEPYVEQIRSSWGHVNAMRDRAEQMDEAASLAAEDDLDGVEAERAGAR